MNDSPCPIRLAWTPFVALFLALFAPSLARADTTYKIQPILKLREAIPGTSFKANEQLWVDALNDRGQLLFGTVTASFSSPAFSYATFLYDNGTYLPIAVPEGEAPSGKWPKRLDYNAPQSMNQSGNIAVSLFDMDRLNRGQPGDLGTFVWEYPTQKFTPVAVTGTAVGDLTFTQASGYRAAINNKNEVALCGRVRTAAGQTLAQALFFRGQDGKLQAVALPGQALPGGDLIAEVRRPDLNDAGRIGFLARRQGQNRFDAYLWEKGTLTSLMRIDTDAPGGRKIVNVWSAYANNKNDTVLVEPQLDKENTGPIALYRYADGKLTPVAVPGQEMPQGGKLQGVTWTSAANDAGQHAFYAELEGGLTAAYLIEADGTLRLILKSGTTSDLGPVSTVGALPNVGFGIALNGRGQVALTLKIDTLPATLALLTPAGP